MAHKVGDKVHIRRIEDDKPLGRGQIIGLRAGQLEVRLAESTQTIVLPQTEVRNFSLAARKAWTKMPKRNVGRPKGSRVSDRVSVTLRADRTLWNAFREAEAKGLVPDRTALFNEWIATYLQSLKPRPIGFQHPMTATPKETS